MLHPLPQIHLSQQAQTLDWSGVSGHRHGEWQHGPAQPTAVRTGQRCSTALCR